jgi:DNA polymerase III alpha subunit
VPLFQEQVMQAGDGGGGLFSAGEADALASFAMAAWSAQRGATGAAFERKDCCDGMLAPTGYSDAFAERLFEADEGLWRATVFRNRTPRASL